MKKILMPILALGLSAVVGVTFGFGATAEDGSLGKRNYGANVDKGSVTAVGMGSSSYIPTTLINPQFTEHPDLFGTGVTIAKVYEELNNQLEAEGYETRLTYNGEPVAGTTTDDTTYVFGSYTGGVKTVKLCFVKEVDGVYARIVAGGWNTTPKTAAKLLEDGEFVKKKDGVTVIEYRVGNPTPNWKTTESVYDDYCNIVSYFEWLNIESAGDNNSTYKNGYASKLSGGNNNPFVELNSKNMSTFYQDLSTNGGDIIIWGLEHATRTSGSPNQKIKVTVGKASGSDDGQVAAGTDTVYNADGSITGGQPGNGSAGTGGLSHLNMGSGATGWETVKGIYIVPGTGTSVTRFAFASESDGNAAQKTMGNYMDNVMFQTLAGNLTVTNTDDGGLKIDGYWGGDPDNSASKLELTLKGDDGNNYNIDIDMSGVSPGSDFEAIIPPTKIEEIKTESGGNVASGDLHHKDYGTPGSGTPITIVNPVKVTFDKKGHGTTDPATQSMAPGKKATTPGGFVVGSEYDGYKFLGWYVNESDTTPFDFNNAIMADTHLIAKWETASGSGITPSPSPSPSPGGGSTGGSSGGGSSHPLNVPSATASGTTVDKAPAAPAPTTQEAPTDTSESIPTVETAPAPAVTVTFQSDLGNIPAPQTMTPGQTAYNPGAPLDPATLAPGTVINGQRFEGWYTDPSFKNAYRFGDPVTEDMVLYAKWTKVGTGAGRSPKTADNNWLFILLAGAMGILSVTGIKLVKTKKRDRFS